MSTKDLLNQRFSKITPSDKNIKGRKFAVLGIITFYSLLGIILLAAIPYGTVEPWFKLSFVFAACCLTFLRILDGIIINKSIFTNKLFLAPLFGILLLAIIQIIPLNQIFNLPTTFLSPISLNIYETKNFILVFFGLLITAEILLHYTNSEKRIRHLIYLVFTISLGSTLFGFTRILFLNGEYNFLSQYLNNRIQFAQFVNQNHYAFLVEMCLGLLLGLQLKAELEKWQKPIYWLMTALSFFSIIWINSRGAILTIVGMCIFAVFLYFLTRNNVYFETKRKRNTSWKKKYLKPILISLLFSILLFGFAAFIISFVGGDPVADRIESIQTEITQESDGKTSRKEIWLATIELIKEYPIFGVGFGAYSIGITKFDKSSGNLALQQAHNDYLEILANGGLIAFVLMLIFILLLIKRIMVQMKSESTFRQASCFGATIGIFGIMLHSMVDFGLHIIINSLILIILVVIATAKIESQSRNSEN